MKKRSATLGAAKGPVVYVVRTDVNEANILDDNKERRVYQMP